MRREIRHGNNAQIEIYNGDCIAGMRAYIADGCIDVVATSPPYNLGTPYRAYDDTISRVDYLDWMERWAEEVFRILHEDGSPSDGIVHGALPPQKEMRRRNPDDVEIAIPFPGVQGAAAA